MWQLSLKGSSVDNKLSDRSSLPEVRTLPPTLADAIVNHFRQTANDTDLRALFKVSIQPLYQFA